MAFRRGVLGFLDLLDRPGDRDVHLTARFQQPFRMLDGFKDLAAIGPFALEDRRAIVQAVGQQVYVRRAPVHHLAIHPDLSVAIVVSRTISHGSVSFARDSVAASA